MVPNLKPISNFHELEIAINNGMLTHEEARDIEEMLFHAQVDNVMDSAMQNELLIA